MLNDFIWNAKFTFVFLPHICGCEKVVVTLRLVNLNQVEMMKRYLAICLAVCAALFAAAQNSRVYMDDFEVAPGSSVTVPIILANQDTTRGVQFSVSLPQGLQCAELNLSQFAERKKFLLNYNVKGNTCKVMVFQVGIANFTPGEITVADITLEADDSFKGGNITFKKCRGSTMDNKSILMDGSTAVVTVPKEGQGGFFLDAAPADD